MYAFLLNHQAICEQLHNGNLENAIILFIDKTKEVMFTPFSRNTYLSSLNFSIYNYILLKENISLHKCCLENEKKILQATSESITQIGIEILSSYDFNPNHLIEKHQNEHIRYALDYIHQHLNMPLTLQTVSQAINVSASYLCQLFRRELNTTFATYVLHQRILLAHSLLQNTDYAIQEIALRCGFKTAAYFSTCYKKVTGHLPSETQSDKSSSDFWF